MGLKITCSARECVHCNYYRDVPYHRVTYDTDTHEILNGWYKESSERSSTLVECDHKVDLGYINTLHFHINELKTETAKAKRLLKKYELLEKRYSKKEITDD